MHTRRTEHTHTCTPKHKARTHACTGIDTHTYIQIHARRQTNPHSSKHTHTHVHTYTWSHTHKHTRTWNCMCTYMYMQMCIYTYGDSRGREKAALANPKSWDAVCHSDLYFLRVRLRVCVCMCACIKFRRFRLRNLLNGCISCSSPVCLLESVYLHDPFCVSPCIRSVLSLRSSVSCARASSLFSWCITHLGNDLNSVLIEIASVTRDH